MTFDIIPIDPLVDEDLATQWIEVQKRSGEADWGDDHCAWALAEIQGRRRGTGYSFVDLAAVQGDSVIGMAAVAMPLLDNTHLALLVLAIGAGSVFFSHVNDAGFWLVKEYFGMTVGQTFKTWSMMETVLSVTGLVLALGLDLVI